jgi:hypothetical protein
VAAKKVEHLSPYRYHVDDVLLRSAVYLRLLIRKSVQKPSNSSKPMLNALPCELRKSTESSTSNTTLVVLPTICPDRHSVSFLEVRPRVQTHVTFSSRAMLRAHCFIFVLTVFRLEARCPSCPVDTYCGSPMLPSSCSRRYTQARCSELITLSKLRKGCADQNPQIGGSFMRLSGSGIA